ncbi:pathogenesis-related protein 1A-like, partial [Diaphorina citri]|uniref:Pathogenesis-related protein 1A-like n=1 Tax=Diaphorina citri TaxID=121845 RepID=A0A1S4EM36_DIACI
VAKVAKVAQAWASKLIGSIARGGHLQHRPNNKFGENIWMGSGYKFTDEEAVKNAVKSWYDEIRHFTQVVWKSSSKLGVGIARKNGHILVVANYDPPGNYQGQYANNVRRS